MEGGFFCLSAALACRGVGLMSWDGFLGPSLSEAAIAIVNLIVIEGILSVDNAAVLATMVMGLPADQRAKALRYGIIGAYAFRGLSLLLASHLMAIWWLEPLGGLYLCYLAWQHFAKGDHQAEEVKDVQKNALFQWTRHWLSPFWATVLAVEVMDMAFSIDNVLAAVAYVKHFPAEVQMRLVCLGVFLGILAMRFAAQGFVFLLARYAFLSNCAFIVIAVLGVKLLLGLPRHLLAADSVAHQMLTSKAMDVGSSVLTLLIFAVPLLLHVLIGWPKGNPSVAAHDERVD